MRRDGIAGDIAGGCNDYPGITRAMSIPAPVFERKRFGFMAVWSVPSPREDSDMANIRPGGDAAHLHPFRFSIAKYG